MSPETWTDVVNWLLLAFGAAMTGGTGLALVRYHRTGVFPGQPLDDEGNPRGGVSVTGPWVRVIVGALVLLWGLAGLVTGSVVGF